MTPELNFFIFQPQKIQFKISLCASKSKLQSTFYFVVIPSFGGDKIFHSWEYFSQWVWIYVFSKANFSHIVADFLELLMRHKRSLIPIKVRVDILIRLLGAGLVRDCLWNSFGILMRRILKRNGRCNIYGIWGLIFLDVESQIDHFGSPSSL